MIYLVLLWAGLFGLFLLGLAVIGVIHVPALVVPTDHDGRGDRSRWGQSGRREFASVKHHAARMAALAHVHSLAGIASYGIAADPGHTLTSDHRTPGVSLWLVAGTDLRKRQAGADQRRCPTPHQSGRRTVA